MEIVHEYRELCFTKQIEPKNSSRDSECAEKTVTYLSSDCYNECQTG